MNKIRKAFVVSAVTLAATACSEFLSSPNTRLDRSGLESAFNTLPVGYASVSNSYAADGGAGPSLFLPGARPGRFGGGMMGGGLGDAFMGGVGFSGGGRFGHRGPFGGGPCADGVFSATTGRVTCPSENRNGLTIDRSAAYKDAAGAVQSAFDSITTNSVNIQSAVTGTLSWTRGSNQGPGGPGGPGGHPRHMGPIAGDTTTILNATTSLNNSSDRTVVGLAQGSTQRVVNGTSRGEENTSGTSSRGTFTARRTAADTTTGLTIPVAIGDGSAPYPTAGTVVRVMSATVQYAGESPISMSRREVITYDGSATAKVVITKDGQTKTCTIALPRGRPTCS